MSNNNEKLSFRLPASLKRSINQIPEDNSEFIRDVLEREVDRRELMKDKQKKKAPAKVERLKELNSEVLEIKEQLSDIRPRFEEIKQTLENLEEQKRKKQSLKEKIKAEIQNETDLDDVMIEGLVGDVE